MGLGLRPGEECVSALLEDRRGELDSTAALCSSYVVGAIWVGERGGRANPAGRERTPRCPGRGGCCASRVGDENSFESDPEGAAPPPVEVAAAVSA